MCLVSITQSAVSSSPEPFILIVVDNRFIFRHAPGLIHYEELPIHESPMNAITGTVPKF